MFQPRKCLHQDPTQVQFSVMWIWGDIPHGCGTGHRTRHAGLRVLATTPIQPLYGYWIYSVSDTVVNLNFDTTNPMFIPAPRSLPAGWSSIGFTGLYPTSARNTFLAVQPDWVNSMGFDAITQSYEPAIFNGDTSESTILYPTKGYWLYMRSPGSLAAIGA